MKVWLITGSRHGHPQVEQVLMNALTGGVPDLVVVGCAKGVDRSVRHWCTEMDIPKKVFIANWKAHGPAAGPKRNQEMVDYVCHLRDSQGASVEYYAFMNGASKGTWDCLTRARSAGISGVVT